MPTLTAITDIAEIKAIQYNTGRIDFCFGIFRPDLLRLFSAYRAGFEDQALYNVMKTSMECMERQ